MGIWMRDWASCGVAKLGKVIHIACVLRLASHPNPHPLPHDGTLNRLLMDNLAAGAVEANHILVGSIDHLPGHFLGSVAIKLRLIA